LLCGATREHFTRAFPESATQIAAQDSQPRLRVREVFMPIRGLSLVGFMEFPQAEQYLQRACIPPDASPRALAAEWNTARARLGDPIEKGGHPEMTAIPAGHSGYLDRVRAKWLGPNAQGFEFRLVEIDRLLAYQHHVSIPRADEHCAQRKGAPSTDELLNVCLPVDAQLREPFASIQGQSIILRSEDLNVRLLQQGTIPGIGGAIGIVVGPALPLVQVVRCNGKCFLNNGFHRAYGMRQRGATHVPCIYRDAAGNYDLLGLRENGATFGRAVMESSNPPTVGHFTQGRAYEVSLRKISRVIQINWSDHLLTDE